MGRTQRCFGCFKTKPMAGFPAGDARGMPTCLACLRQMDQRLTLLAEKGPAAMAALTRLHKLFDDFADKEALLAALIASVAPLVEYLRQTASPEQLPEVEAMCDSLIAGLQKGRAR